MPLPRDTSGRETRGPDLLNTGLYTPGDYVVPQFTESGSKAVKGQVLGGSEEVMSLARKMAAHAALGGAEMLPAFIPSASQPVAPQPAKKKAKAPTTRKATSPSVVDAEEVTPVLKIDGLQPSTIPPVSNTILQPSPPPTLRAQEEISSPPIEVVFSTQLGRIRLNALAVLDSSNALALVFANEGEIRYEPAPGTEVQLIVSGKLQDTMYPGFKFSWMDDKKVVMVFVKLPDEE